MVASEVNSSQIYIDSNEHPTRARSRPQIYKCGYEEPSWYASGVQSEKQWWEDEVDPKSG